MCSALLGRQLSAQTQHSLVCWSQVELQLICPKLVSRHLHLRVISDFTDELHVCEVDHPLLIADIEHSGHLGPAPAPDPHLPGLYSHRAGNTVVGCSVLLYNGLSRLVTAVSLSPPVPC